MAGENLIHFVFGKERSYNNVLTMRLARFTWQQDFLLNCLFVHLVFTESFNRRISVLKSKCLAVVAACILRLLDRTEPDVWIMPVFLHLLLIMEVEKRNGKTE